jgi:hypothetical protein
MEAFPAEGVVAVVAEPVPTQVEEVLEVTVRYMSFLGKKYYIWQLME